MQMPWFPGSYVKAAIKQIILSQHLQQDNLANATTIKGDRT